MTDVLVRDVSPKTLAKIDRSAQHHGLTRAQYLRQILEQVPEAPANPVTMEDLREFARATQDLADPEVMARAWS